MAEAWRQAADHTYDLIVFLGTNHFTPGFDRVAVWTGGPWRTPLGLTEIDTRAAEALIAVDGQCCVADPWPHLDEHSIEVQLPFAQTLFPDVPVLPLLVGLEGLQSREYFGELLAEFVADRKALLFASSDLSHYPSRSDAKSIDGETIEAIVSLDSERLQKSMANQMNSGMAQLATCACGEAPIMVAMAAAGNMGSSGGTLLAYSNSGEVPVGDESRVVGYAAISFSVTNQTGRH
jgi:AmmeMemoRadiSam system protein B